MTKRKQSKSEEEAGWPRKISLNGVTVPVYRRVTMSGNLGYQVLNRAGGTRRLESYPTEEKAIEAAEKLARLLSEQDTIRASMTKEQGVEYASALQQLGPLNLTLPAVVANAVECVKLVGDLSRVAEACKFYVARHKQTTPKRVADVIDELLKVKESRGAAVRYIEDLRNRFKRIAGAFVKEAGNVTTADVQSWLDAQGFGAQQYSDYRNRLHLLFNFAVARGYAVDNPVERVEKIKVRRGETQVFTATEIARLLSKATPEFLPVLALGAFAGVRSAELERMEWSDIDLAGRHVIVGANRAKTAGRRVIPMNDALFAWLQPYGGREGRIWPGTHDAFYDAQKETAAATEVKADAANGIKAQKPVKWKPNALRHSYASYRFAQTGDAGRVAGELGNSAAVVHKHYRELVKPVDAERYFNIKPEAPANVVTLAAVNS